MSGGSTPAKGKVVLKSGTTVVSQAERVLDSSGRATLTIPKGSCFRASGPSRWRSRPPTRRSPPPESRRRTPTP
ncbi:hypothetical protein ACHMWU_20225 [Aeromicrobium sp. UC242_57]